MEARSAGGEVLLSWAYADCNPLAYHNPLRWSGKKTFELTAQEITCHNANFARPIYIKEYDQSGSLTRAYGASSYDELDSIHSGQGDATSPASEKSDTWTVTFRPGDLGFDCTDNFVTSLTPGGQAECGGMKLGMIPSTIQDIPFTPELLDEWKSGDTTFNITFKVESFDVACDDVWYDPMGFGIWEYQRYWPNIGWLRPGLIGAGDPPNYADDDGGKVDQPPETWRILKSGATDAEGWEFATAFVRFDQPRQYGRGVRGPKDRLRRRRWVPTIIGGVSFDELSQRIADRSKRKRDALHGVGRQMRALISSRSVFRNLDLLNLVSWARLRRRHLLEYQSFLEKLPLADCGGQHQFEEMDWAVSLPTIAEIMYTFRFMIASYGSAFTVDSATQRKKMLQLSGLSAEDSILQIKEEGETLRPAYALFIDHSEQRCILTIRGTATTEDALTNTVAEPIFDEVLDAHVHPGIRDAAVWLLGEVSIALKSAAAANPQYALWITGHSLGAGVAALATLLIGHQEPHNYGFHSVQGIGFATPCVVTLAIAEGERAMKNFTTIVCARDAIVRTCVPNIYMMHHEVAMVSNRSKVPDCLGRVLGGRVQRYAESRHTVGAEIAEQRSGPKCFPVGACIVLADPGEDSARALVAKPRNFSKYFVHEEMAFDHSTDRYEIGLRCLGASPRPAGDLLFFGAVAHHDWGEVEGQLFGTEIEARQKYATFSLFIASMIVSSLGEVIAYHGMDKDRGKSRKDEMMDWYQKACKNEVYGNNGPYSCMQHIQFGEVKGWSFDSVKGAREKFKSLGLLKACMIVDKYGNEVAFYGVDYSSRTAQEAKTVKEDMLRWFRENVMDCPQDHDNPFGSYDSQLGCSFQSCFSADAAI